MYGFGRGEILFSGGLKGWALKSKFFGAQMALATLIPISGPKKSQFLGSPLQTHLVMDYSPIQIHMSRPPAPYKQQVH